MGTKHQVIRALLTDAIIDLCRREAFYVEELRIEGTVCLVSDRSSVLVAQITEQIGEQTPEGAGATPRLNYEHEDPGDEGKKVVENPAEGTLEKCSGQQEKSGHNVKQGIDNKNFIKGALLDRDASKLSAASLKKKESDLMDSMMPSERTNGKYKCPFCPKVYGFKHNLKDHINKHTGKKPHVCKYCGMSFTFLASLCGHIKRRHFHCMPREHQCQICGNRFPNKQSLKQHYTWRHSAQKAGTQARQSGAGQRTISPRQRKSSSPRHQDVASINEVKINIEGERLVDVEPPNCKSLQIVRDHEKARAVSTTSNQQDGGYNDNKVNESPAQPDAKNMLEACEDMDLSQLQALGLTQPRLSPDQPSPGLFSMPLPLLQATSMGFPMFPPPLPMFSIPTSPSPTSQVPTTSPSPTSKTPKTATPELYRSANGKFQCPYCEKAYRFKHTLKDHINTHFGKRPHCCKYCGDSFTHFASLCAHIKRRHKEHIPKDFACTICNENFMNLQSLKQHFTWRHKDLKLPPGVLPYQGGETSGRRLSGPRRDSGEPPPKSSPSAACSSSSMSPLQSPDHRRSPATPLSPNHLMQGHPQAQGHPLMSPTSPKLPSMDAFIKSGALGSLPHFPGFPHQALHPDHMGMMKDMKDILGGMTFDNLQAMGGAFPPGLFAPQAYGAPGTSAPQGNDSKY